MVKSQWDRAGIHRLYLRAKSSPHPMFVNEVLSKHSYTYSFPVVSGCFSTIRQNWIEGKGYRCRVKKPQGRSRKGLVLGRRKEIKESCPKHSRGETFKKRHIY